MLLGVLDHRGQVFGSSTSAVVAVHGWRVPVRRLNQQHSAHRYVVAHPLPPVPPPGQLLDGLLVLSQAPTQKHRVTTLTLNGRGGIPDVSDGEREAAPHERHDDDASSDEASAQESDAEPASEGDEVPPPPAAQAEADLLEARVDELIDQDRWDERVAHFNDNNLATCYFCEWDTQQR